MQRRKVIQGDNSTLKTSQNTSNKMQIPSITPGYFQGVYISERKGEADSMCGGLRHVDTWQ